MELVEDDSTLESIEALIEELDEIIVGADVSLWVAFNAVLSVQHKIMSATLQETYGIEDDGFINNVLMEENWKYVENCKRRIAELAKPPEKGAIN